MQVLQKKFMTEQREANKLFPAQNFKLLSIYQSIILHVLSIPNINLLDAKPALTG